MEGGKAGRRVVHHTCSSKAAANVAALILLKGQIDPTSFAEKNNVATENG
jgi:hypothetical protein